jgi:hypothetical protein
MGDDGFSGIDRLNFCTVRLNAKFQDLDLGWATGFFYSLVLNDVPSIFLITNWHVLAGRHIDPPYAAPSRSGAVPDRFEAILVRQNPELESAGQIQTETVTISLYTPTGDPIWIQHPKGSFVDIAALNLGPIEENYRVPGINKLALQHDMAIEIGNDVFVLGYPLGFAHFLNMPVWKKGSIASEPHSEVMGAPPRIVIDATTRGGMSGSPVVMREKTHYLTDTGEIKSVPNATRFIGVYSSRPGIDDVAATLRDDSRERAEIGYVYKSGALDELLRAQHPGLKLGELP